MSPGIFNRRRPGKAAVFRTRTERIDERMRLGRTDIWALTLSLLVIVAMLTNPERLYRLYGAVEPISGDIAPNEVAVEEWRAEFAFETADLRNTDRARDEAAARVLDIYTVEPLAYREQMAAFDERIEAVRGQRDAAREAIDEALMASNSNDDPAIVAAAAAQEFAASIADSEPFQNWITPEQLALMFTPAPSTLPQRTFADPAEDASEDTARETINLTYPEGRQLSFAGEAKLTEWARKSLDVVLYAGILDPQSDVLVDPDKKIRILRRRTLDNTLASSEELAVGRVLNPATARDALRLRLREQFDATELSEVLPTADVAVALEAAYELAEDFVAANLQFNEGDTTGSTRAARSEVAPVLKTIERGEIIQADGERWTEQSVSDAETYIDKRLSGREPLVSFVLSMVSNVLLTVLMLIAVVKSLPVMLGRNQERGQILRVTLLVIVVMVVVGRIAAYFDPTGFVVPAAAAAILLAILTNARVAGMAAIILAVLLSVQYEYDWSVFFIASMMGAGGAMSITKVRRRSDMARACFQATAAGLAAASVIALAREAFDWNELSRTFFLIGLNGAVCLFIVPGALPPLERLLGIITDIQLLEYSDLNNEVLSRLAIEVPATYAHSLALGQLAEAACEAIGANGLLARVSAYYHDIGKIRRPEYFIENQTGQNVHDGLSPRLSARAIASHVIEGAEMARELHLPQPMIDAILEHHGTCLISFFYQQAKDQSKHDDVREEDYRYPGPKPQSRETAILMICDAIESGVRSIKSPNEERVREFVDRIIRSRSKDRQFDECDLTLRDLDTIGDVVAQRVLSTLHTRIAYPPQPGGRDRADNVIPLSSGSE